MSKYNPETYRKYYEEHRDEKIADVCLRQKATRPERRAYEHKRYEQVRREVIEHYGGVCACCGESEIAFLQIDHINGNGNKHRRQIERENHGRVPMALWLKRNGYPEGFQVLCANCNIAKHTQSICPHQKKLAEAAEMTARPEGSPSNRSYGIVSQNQLWRYEVALSMDA